LYTYDIKREKDLKDLTFSLSININNTHLYHQAFIHKSFTHENNDKSYERLELLGDSILTFIIIKKLFDIYLDKTEGEISKIKDFLVSENFLYTISKSLNFDQYILLSKGERNSGNIKKSIVADVFESFLGALYLDQGLEESEKFILNHFENEMIHLENYKKNKNYKTILQEYFHKT